MQMACEEYEFRNGKGVAVILVNGSFDLKTWCAPRAGAEKDLDMAKKTFKELGFEVRGHLDQTTTQMLSHIKQGKLVGIMNYSLVGKRSYTGGGYWHLPVNLTHFFILLDDG